MSNGWLVFCFIGVCIVGGAVASELGRWCGLHFSQKFKCDNCPYKKKVFDGGTITAK